MWGLVRADNDAGAAANGTAGVIASAITHLLAASPAAQEWMFWMGFAIAALTLANLIGGTVLRAWRWWNRE